MKDDIIISQQIPLISSSEILSPYKELKSESIKKQIKTKRRKKSFLIQLLNKVQKWSFKKISFSYFQLSVFLGFVSVVSFILGVYISTPRTSFYETALYQDYKRMLNRLTLNEEKSIIKQVIISVGQVNKKVTLRDIDRISYYVVLYSRLYGLDPALVLAIIETESNFYVKAVSYKGAYGLVQNTFDGSFYSVLSDITGFENALSFFLSKREMYDFFRKSQHTIKTNLYVGITYFVYLYHLTNGNLEETIKRYFAGGLYKKYGEPYYRKVMSSWIKYYKEIKKELIHEV